MLERSLTKAADLYEQDFFLWTQQMATALREGRFEQLDLENLAEEVESVGRSEKRELASRLRVLLIHLLKWQFQPERRSHSWQSTITEQRIQLELLLEDSPSLKRQALEMLEVAYRQARVRASEETQMAIATFPEDCPYVLIDILRSDFWLDSPDLAQ
jgi:predicted DNA-binding ribbon-helix-helix protein